MRVSLPLTAERGSIRVAFAALCTIAVLAVVAVGLPTPAHAAITACENGAPTGGVETIGIQGSSLQKSAIEFWNSSKIYLSENLDAFGCGSGGGKVEYLSKSSGCGLDSMGAGIAAEGCSLSGKYEEAGYRDSTVRIGASDFPPDAVEQENINNGPTGGQHAGKIHVLPVASAAVAVVVHFPAGCSLTNTNTEKAASGVGTVNDDITTGGVNDPTNLETGDTEANESLRVHITAQALEEIWEHKITTWGAIPTPTGNSTLGAWMSPSSCAAAPIFRIARFDTSGTTYNFKAYLSLLPSFGEDGGTKLWKEGQVGSTNTAWPLSEAGKTGIPAEVAKVAGEMVKSESGAIVAGGAAEECTTTISPNQICRANAEGGGALAKAVNATNGSIGYLDLATARKEGFTMEVSKDDHTYWLPLQAVNPAASEPSNRIEDPLVFDEPTTHPMAHFSTTQVAEKGANCEKADYRGFPTASAAEPDPTLANWSNAIATGGSAYPVCAITYDLAFQNDASVYGSQAPEEERARTVKEYLSSVLSVRGQTELPEFDYGVLPNTKGNPLLEDSQKGVAAIEWNPTGSSGGNTNTNTNKTATTTTTTNVIAPAVVPSNAFSIAGAKVKNKDIVLSLVLPDAGKVQIKVAGGGVTVASVNSSVSGGNGTVSLPISKSAQAKLAKVKGHKLSVKITVTFTPTGGSAASQSKTITLTQAELAAKKVTKKKPTKVKKK
ncbi:MAG: hypothetical protein WBQ21_14435 [Solirubrobacteraceae bacterium]